MGEKKIIKEKLPYDVFNGSIYDISQGTCDEIIEAYRRVKSSAEAIGYKDVTFNIATSWGDIDYRCYGLREETDEEFEQRKQRSEKAKQAAKKRKETMAAKRREQYEKLKKEFE